MCHGEDVGCYDDIVQQWVYKAKAQISNHVFSQLELGNVAIIASIIWQIIMMHLSGMSLIVIPEDDFDNISTVCKMII